MLRDDTHEQLATRDTGDDIMAAIVNTRGIDPQQAIQARNWLSELAGAMEEFVLRDVTPEELAARDGLNDIVKRFLNSRESGPNQARNWLSKLASAMEEFVLRDVTPDELAARDDLDDFMNTYFLNTRESVSQPDIQARSAPDGPSKTVARDTVADSFIDALLKSRDSSGITPDDLLALASLASRTLNDLD